MMPPAARWGVAGGRRRAARRWTRAGGRAVLPRTRGRRRAAGLPRTRGRRRAGSAGPVVACGPVSLFAPADLDRTLVTLGRLAAAAAGALVVTGALLVVGYRPEGALGWVSSLHWLASALLVGCAAGVLACVALAAVRHHRTWVGWAVAVAGFAVSGGGAATGQLLRWTDVRPPGEPRGLFGPLGGGVDAVVVGGSTVSPSAYLAWSLVHVLLVPAAAVAVGLWFTRRRRRWETSLATPAPTGTPGDRGGPPVPADPPDGPTGAAAP